ncbi:MAG: D-alanyl-D-alanine carboxypeptidase [Candidatus Melainabacteria bacterium]|nr:D-alanyl-D-alanine carboxypeptidase [Candidatus Melainabacteria bacterium]
MNFGIPVSKKLNSVLGALLALSFLLPVGVDARVSGVGLAAGKMRMAGMRSTTSRYRSAAGRHGRRSAHRGHQSRHRRTARARPAQHSEVAVLVEAENGTVITDKNSNVAFNPASVVKLITAYAALKSFAPDHRFTTTLYLDGELDEDTGVMTGDAYIEGLDPDFKTADTAELIKELHELGVKKIEGKLIVSPQFSMNWSGNPVQSGRSLVAALKRGHGGARITVKGAVVVGNVSPTAMRIVTHESEPLKQSLKHMLAHSINPMSEQMGRCVGGVQRLQEVAVKEAGVAPGNVTLSTASGLGINRVNAHDMMIVLKALRKELQNNGLDLSDILPLAGIESGTMDRRFTGAQERGSVIAKTGTLTSTDGGVSALAGIARSDREDLYFIIFCWKGSINGFRREQDQLIRQLQATRGGPRRFDDRVAHLPSI